MCCALHAARSASASASASESAAEALPSPLQPIVVPESDDPNVLVPPTPTKLLSREETEGVTSGAVQPPGSTGEDSVHNHSRRSSRNIGDETDGSTSFTDEDDIEEGTPIEEVEDEEERLIMQGGAGIPIGPVSFSALSLPRDDVRSNAPIGRHSKTITAPTLA